MIDDCDSMAIPRSISCLSEGDAVKRLHGESVMWTTATDSPYPQATQRQEIGGVF